MSKRNYIPGLDVANYKKCESSTGLETSKYHPIPVNLLTEYEKKTKNPVAAIYEYAAHYAFEISFETQEPDDPSMQGFFVACFINKFKYPQGGAKNRKLAKCSAAQEAIEYIKKNGLIVSDDSLNYTHEEKAEESLSYNLKRDLMSIMARFNLILNVDDLNHMSDENRENLIKECMWTYASPELIKSLTNHPPTHYDRVLLEVKSTIRSQQLDLLCNKFAAFLVKDSDGLKVVSIGGGDGLVSRAVRDGRILADSRAITLARRAFVKYLHDQINAFLKKEESIFTRENNNNDDTDHYLFIKKDVSFHLYLTDSPIPINYHSPYMMSLQEIDEISCDIHHACDGGWSIQHIPHPDQSLNRGMSSVSEADKVLMWNMVGLQGALLSRFIKPVYLSSITIGDGFQAADLQRQLCCRLPDNLSTSKHFFLHHPFIGRPSIYAHPIFIQSNKSVNWIINNPKNEYINPMTGLATEDSPFKSSEKLASRLCKFASAYRYTTLQNELGGFSRTSYNGTKQDTEYASIKKQAQEYMCGNDWPHKCKQFDQFMLPQ